MSEILCLGDSITDCGHLWDFAPLGNGYVCILDRLLNKRRSCFHLTNRGYDGFTLQRLLLNLSETPISRKYDLITLLIGINDVSLISDTEPDPSRQKKMLSLFLDKYEQIICLLSKCLQNADLKNLVIIEPFLFPVPMYRLRWFPLLQEMQMGIHALAQQYQVSYLSTHAMLNQKYRTQSTVLVTSDGVHLTENGHMLLAQELFQLINTNQR